MIFKLSYLNLNLALTLGYLNPALNYSALVYNWTTVKHVSAFKLYIEIRIWWNCHFKLTLRDMDSFTTLQDQNLQNMLFKCHTNLFSMRTESISTILLSSAPRIKLSCVLSLSDLSL